MNKTAGSCHLIANNFNAATPAICRRVRYKTRQITNFTRCYKNWKPNALFYSLVMKEELYSAVTVTAGC